MCAIRLAAPFTASDPTALTRCPYTLLVIAIEASGLGFSTPPGWVGSDQLVSAKMVPNVVTSRRTVTLPRPALV